MTDSLRFWQINYPDRPFKSLLVEHSGEPLFVSQLQQKAWNARLVEYSFKAVFQRRSHSFSLCRSVPSRSRSDCPGIGSKAYKHCVSSVTFAHKLTYIQFSTSAHFGGSRIAQM